MTSKLLATLVALMFLTAIPVSAGAWTCTSNCVVDHKCIEITNVTVDDVYKLDSPLTHLKFSLTPFHGDVCIQGPVVIRLEGIQDKLKVNQTQDNMFDVILDCTTLDPGTYNGTIKIVEFPEQHRTIIEPFSFTVYAGSAIPVDPITFEDLTDPRHGQPGTLLNIIHRATNTGDTNITIEPDELIITDSAGEVVDAGDQSSFLGCAMVVPAHSSVNFTTSVSIPRGTPTGAMKIDITYNPSIIER